MHKLKIFFTSIQISAKKHIMDVKRYVLTTNVSIFIPSVFTVHPGLFEEHSVASGPVRTDTDHRCSFRWPPGPTTTTMGDSNYAVTVIIITYN